MRGVGGLVCVLALIGAVYAEPAGGSAAEARSEARELALLQGALGAYDEALNLAQTEPATARDLYRKAIRGFLALRDAGVRNAALEYNLGNVYARLGERGRAMLHFLRAAKLAPGDHNVQANLEYTRNLVEPHIAPAGEQRVLQQVLFWHYRTSPMTRYRAAVAFGGVGWALLFGWLWWRRRGIAIGGLIAVVLGMAMVGSLWGELRAQEATPGAVVVGQETHLYLGRSTAADLAFKRPLGPGVELRVLQRVGEWVRVALRNGQTGWLPAEAIEVV